MLRQAGVAVSAILDEPIDLDPGVRSLRQVAEELEQELNSRAGTLAPRVSFALRTVADPMVEVSAGGTGSVRDALVALRPVAVDGAGWVTLDGHVVLWSAMQAEMHAAILLWVLDIRPPETNEFGLPPRLEAMGLTAGGDRLERLRVFVAELQRLAAEATNDEDRALWEGQAAVAQGQVDLEVLRSAP